MIHPHKRRTGFNRMLHASRHSISGLATAYRTESAFRQEVWLVAPLVPLAFWVGHGWVEIMLLAGSAVWVLTVELLNSAVEAVVDRVSLELHDLSKRAKDYGSAAVLLSLVLAGGIWAAALWSRLSS